MKMQTWVSPLPPDFSDSVSLGGLRTCICNKFSGDTGATRPRTRTAWENRRCTGLDCLCRLASPALCL